MKCHYEVLGVERTATDDELKKAYRKRALQFHPDKNRGREEECQKQFVLVQQAYEILSDPKERSWYDDHREKILHGDDFDGSGIDLMPFFCPSVFTGYGDDENGFYSVYSKVFKNIAEEDSSYVESDTDAMPKFGNSKTGYKPEVEEFYDVWQSYCTPNSFVWVEEYDVREAPESKNTETNGKENKKLRDAARKARNEEVRALVDFVKKRDKRVKAYREEMKQREEEKKLLNQQKRSKEKRERVKEHQSFEEQQWASMDTLEQEMMQMEMHLDNEFGAHDDEDDYDSEEEVIEECYCIACDKYFKTEKSLQNHEKSRKHKDNVTFLKNEMGKDQDLFELDSENDVSPVEDGVHTKLCSDDENDLSGINREQTDVTRLSSDENTIPETSIPSSGTNHEEVSEIPKSEELSTNLSEVLLKDSNNAVHVSKPDDKDMEQSVLQNGEEHVSDEEVSQLTEESVSKPCTYACKICKSSFQTRNMLFKHIKNEGHAEVKHVENKNSNTKKKASKNSRKKR